MTFPHTRLDLQVELLLLGQWVEMAEYQTVVDDFYADVYDDIYGGRSVWVENRLMSSPQIRVGRGDESSLTSPAQVSVVLDNPDGALTPDNPLSQWWPDVRRGILMRVRVGDDVRFVGEVAEIAPTWPLGDLSGVGYDGEARVQVTAAGPLRRLGQASAERSALYRKVTRTAEVSDYWPLEDGSTEDGSASGLEGSPPSMLLANVALGGASTIPGASGMAHVASGATATWNVRLTGPSSTSWTVGVAFTCPTPPESGQIVRVMDVLTDGDPYRYVADLNFGTVPELLYQVFYRDGTLAATAATPATYELFGLPVMMELTCAQSGGNVDHNLRWVGLGVGGVAFGLGTSPVAGTVGRPSNFSGTAQDCPSGGFSFGQVTVRSGVANYWLLDAAKGHNGEAAGNRLLRIATEEGISLSMVGAAADTAWMGPQPSATPLGILRDCESADDGILFERMRSTFGLQYRTLVSRYNELVELTLDADESEIANPFAPVHDDQAVVNDVTVKRTAGSQHRVTDDDSIDLDGRYDKSYTLNLHSDVANRDAAGWKLHVGTWEGMRVPQITFDLAIAPQLIDAWVLIAAGDRVQVTNLPPQWPLQTLDLIFQGWVETLEPFSWTVTANCTPAGPWDVGILEDDAWGLADTAGSQLAAAVDDNDTTLSVATTVGPIWTIATGPFDILLNGEVMTVTNVTGASSPQSLTVTRGVYGVARAHAAGLPLSLAAGILLAR